MRTLSLRAAVSAAALAVATVTPLALSMPQAAAASACGNTTADWVGLLGIADYSGTLADTLGSGAVPAGQASVAFTAGLAETVTAAGAQPAAPYILTTGGGTNALQWKIGDLNYTLGAAECSLDEKRTVLSATLTVVDLTTVPYQGSSGTATRGL